MYYADGINEEPWYPPQRPIIRGIGDATKQLSKIQRLEIGPSNTTYESDCFSLLAIEIRLEIASHLSTLDYLGLRSVSRAMALVFSLQSFWKTRFRVNGDRGYLACLADPGAANVRTGDRFIAVQQILINRISISMPYGDIR